MRSVDTRGKRCPIPVIEVARLVADAAPGEVVEVVSDDAAARVDIPVWCRMKGHGYEGEEPREGGVAYRVRRTG